MPLTTAEWHARFTVQARWTRDLRAYLFYKAGLPAARQILDVGCGTGVLETELAQQFSGVLAAIDFDPAMLDIAQSQNASLPRRALYTQADASRLPFPDDNFDISFCHYLLLWIRQPLHVMGEMRRVTTPGGKILALAEPDYGGRIDFPDRFKQLNELQEASLHSQGADPHFGRKLARLFTQAGLSEVEVGVLGGQWITADQLIDWDSEWQVIASDLEEDITGEELESLRQLDLDSRLRKERIAYVPTFYAMGTVTPLY
jgi:ubiquinone/menaquinone biosynthesis C-methylase UbiE